ncbi:NapC/NirT family cytochrome c [bacterium]|nr:NapC/NirT family cytochrome c [candidate division CSSED10-310 bacterium]
MVNLYLHFIRRVSINWIGRLGVILTTSSFITFVCLEILRLGGIMTNAYIGLITYLTFPTLFIAGLLLIPLAWWIQKRREHRSIQELAGERFDADDLVPRPMGSRLVLTISGLTFINIVFMTGASFRTLQFMDSATFCGTACHRVMNPEWTTYQVSPHARVKCVECHVGEGIEALIDSKLSGARQMLMLIFDAYNRPIHTPVKELRPARETCEKCHWPEKFYGRRMDVFEHFRPDETSTPFYTTLNLKIDTGREANHSGIHWHIAAVNEVRYTSVDDERKTMIWVDVRRPDGSYHRYTNRHVVMNHSGMQTPLSGRSTDVRVMDCVDCHNRATHIYEDPENAVDRRLALEQVDRTLPYIKREMLHALTINYSDNETARKGIENHIHGFYRNSYPHLIESQLPAIDEAVRVAREIYDTHVHHTMDLTWNTYPSFNHHQRNTGCFRCHNENVIDSGGNAIAFDCTACHSILAYESETPLHFVGEPDPKDPEFPMHRMLRDEFLGLL